MTRSRSHWFVPSEGALLFLSDGPNILFNDVHAVDPLLIKELAFANRRAELRDVAGNRLRPHVRDAGVIGSGPRTARAPMKPAWIVRALDRLFAVRSA